MSSRFVGGNPTPLGYLRQFAVVAGAVPTSAPYGLDLTLKKGLLGAPNSRLVIAQAISGPGHGHNTAVVNGNTFPIDVGNDDSINSFSTDISTYNEQSGDAGITIVSSRLTANYSPSFMAAWVAEYTDIDQSNYGYQGNAKDSNGNVDYDASVGGTGSGATATCTRSGGKTCNYTPELAVWAIGGTGNVAVNSQTYNSEGYVTENANIWLAVQDAYFNAIGTYNPAFNLASAASYWNWFNFSMKVLAYPT